MDYEIEFFSDRKIGTVRALELDGQGWVFACDVFRKIGYHKSSTHTIMREIVSRNYITDKDYQKIFIGNRRNPFYILNKAGIQGFILSSKKTKANVVGTWLLSKVFPAMNKNNESCEGTFSILNNGFNIFINKRFDKVRTINLDGQSWIVATDVLKALEYLSSSSFQYFIYEGILTDKDYRKISKGKLKYKINLINKTGVQNIISISTKPRAKEIGLWLFSDVFPAIEPTIDIDEEVPLPIIDEDEPCEEYPLPTIDEDEPCEEGIPLPDEKQKLEEDELIRKAIEIAKKSLAKKIAPKQDYRDVILDGGSAISSMTIAKDYGYDIDDFNILLEDLGVQYKNKGTWLLCTDHKCLGYITSFVDNGFMWTKQGRYFLYKLLKQKNILPLIEKGVA